MVERASDVAPDADRAERAFSLLALGAVVRRLAAVVKRMEERIDALERGG